MNEALVEQAEALTPVINDIQMYAELLNLSSGSKMEVGPQALQTLSGKLYDITLALEQIQTRLKSISER